MVDFTIFVWLAFGNFVKIRFVIFISSRLAACSNTIKYSSCDCMSRNPGYILEKYKSEVFSAEVQIFLNPPLFVFPSPSLQNFDALTSLAVLRPFSVYGSLHDEKFMICSLHLTVEHWLIR